MTGGGRGGGREGRREGGGVGTIYSAAHDDPMTSICVGQGLSRTLSTVAHLLLVLMPGKVDLILSHEICLQGCCS